MPVPNKVGLHDASVRWAEADKTSLLNPDAISSYDKIVERKRGGCVEHDKSIGNCDRLQFPGEESFLLLDILQAASLEVWAMLADSLFE